MKNNHSKNFHQNLREADESVVNWDDAIVWTIVLIATVSYLLSITKTP